VISLASPSCVPRGGGGDQEERWGLGRWVGRSDRLRGAQSNVQGLAGVVYVSFIAYHLNLIRADGTFLSSERYGAY
jgi:hypothetical protein